MLSIDRSNISGSYTGTRQGVRLDLRIDLGEQNSLDVISGDVSFETSPGTFEFHHSFQTTALVPEVSERQTVLRGPVKVHRENMLNVGRLDLVVPEVGDITARYLLFRFESFGRTTPFDTQFQLDKVSTFFREIEVEMESVQGVPFPVPFNTSGHPDTPQSHQGRTLTLATAYRDAGINMSVVNGREEIPVTEAGVDGLWSEEELHAAMVQHHDEHRDAMQWHLYLLLATKFVRQGVLGIMFDAADSDNFHRQGAAVFHDHPSISGAVGEEKNREYLFTLVHELGHAFNFLHSFQKGIIETHGVLPRPDAFSWMNYPDLFPFGRARPAGWNGSNRFWSEFGFSFDGDEIHHLRHNDRAEVIPGGRSFGFAGHFEERPFERPTKENDVELVLWTPKTLEFMQQLESDIRLRNVGAEHVKIPVSLDPSSESLDVIIQRPNSPSPEVYRGFMTTCVRGDDAELAPNESVYQEILAAYGRRRWFIDEPGTYKMQVVVKLPDRRRIVSNLQTFRVLQPSPESDLLAADFFNDDVGVYFGVEGSRSERLDGARATADSLFRRDTDEHQLRTRQAR